MRRIDPADYMHVKFGDWEVVGHLGLRPRSGRRATFFLCRCACGLEKEICAYDLNQADTRRCRRCANRRAGACRTTHGQSRPIRVDGVKKKYRYKYNLYMNMRKNAVVHGVSIDPRWTGRDGFAHFREDLDLPGKGRAWIVRLDKRGPFTAANVRVEMKRPQRTYQFEGQSYTAGELAFLVDMNVYTLKWRLDRGMSVAAALRCPVAKCGRRKVKPPAGVPEPHCEASRSLPEHDGGRP